MHKAVFGLAVAALLVVSSTLVSAITIAEETAMRLSRLNAASEELRAAATVDTEAFEAMRDESQSSVAVARKNARAEGASIERLREMSMDHTIKQMLESGDVQHYFSM